MTRRLLASYLALTIVVLVALEVPLAVVNARNEQQDLTAKVERDAFAAASLAEDTLQAGGTSPHLVRIVRRYQAQTGGRVVIVDKHGRSIADSHPTVPKETSFASRPEIAAALRGEHGVGHPQLGDARYEAALRRRAGRVRGQGLRRRSHHVPDLGARSPHQPLPARARRGRADRAGCRGTRRTAARPFDREAASPPRGRRRARRRRRADRPRERDRRPVGRAQPRQ